MTARSAGRTQACTEAQARARLDQARRFLDVGGQDLRAALRQAAALVKFDAVLRR